MSFVTRFRSWYAAPTRRRPSPRGPRRRPMLEQLEGRDLPNATLPLHLDLGPARSPAAYGYAQVGLVTYNATRGFGWADTTGIHTRDRGGADLLTRDFQQGRDGTLLIDLPNGTYTVTLTLGDAFYHREGINISLQGQTVASNLTTGRNQFVKESFQAQVTNGRLTIALHDAYKHYQWALDGIDIVPVPAAAPAAPSPAPVITPPPSTPAPAPVVTQPPPAPVPTQPPPAPVTTAPPPATSPPPVTVTLSPAPSSSSSTGGTTVSPLVSGSLYVSTTGNDTNSGTSSSAPLRNIATALARVQPGETIYIAGGTYYEHLVTTVAGAAGSVITLTGYNGTPIIDGSTQGWALGGNQNLGVIELRQPYYKLEGLEVLNSQDTGIVLGASHLTVDSCTIGESQRHAISTDTKYQLQTPGSGSMIGDITLTSNNVYHSVIKGQGYGQAISLIADGFIVNGNNVHDNYTEGIDIWLGSKHGEVGGNNIHANARAGIYVDGASYVRIDRNLIYGQVRDGIGVSSENVHYSTHDIWVYQNIVRDGGGFGLFIWDSSTHPGFHGSQNVLLANNTLINNTKGSIYLAGDSNTATIVNNLSYTAGNSLYNSATNSTFSIHNNVWLTGLSGFVNALLSDYHLLAASPAIGAGSTLPVLRDDLGNSWTISKDYDGNARVLNGRMDAGVYEFQ